MTTDAYVPTREDRFSFGIWTVGWQGVDVFGSAVRPAMPADRAVRKLAEPDRVTPAANASAVLAGGVLTIELPPVSWTAAALS